MVSGHEGASSISHNQSLGGMVAIGKQAIEAKDSITAGLRILLTSVAPLAPTTPGAMRPAFVVGHR